ncbi:MAG: phosphoribosyltransferase family protein [Sulfolobales archaeon]|nr:phosphoribosyltransferase family protein [Sulfolobales archaeon]MDW8010778.1 phosphoribosyltransferase family protein [Sulfolobales archaeon]
MTGFFSLLFFESGWNVHSFVDYGLSVLRHRGGSLSLICWKSGDRVSCEEYGNGETRDRPRSRAVVTALLDRRRVDEHVVRGDRVAVVSDRPSRYLGEVAGIVEKALASAKPHEELSKHLRVLKDVDVPTFTAVSSREEVVAWRSSLGLTPLAVGGYGFDMAVTSTETSLIEVLDADVRRHLLPGEGLYISKNQVRLFNSGSSSRCRLCLFELLYTARHDSIVDGVSVYEFRKKLGESLGRYLESRVDAIVGVPETAIPYAIGLSRSTGVPLEFGFVSTAREARSMLKECVRDRLVAVHLKLNPVRRVLEGKSIAVVDDSMVTGSTLKTVAQLLRYRIGVREIHVFIASPKLVSTCPYGVVALDPETLISAHLDELSIEKYLDVDSVNWLRDEDVDSVADLFRIRLCAACFGRDLVGEGR